MIQVTYKCQGCPQISILLRYNLSECVTVNLKHGLHHIILYKYSTTPKLSDILHGTWTSPLWIKQKTNMGDSCHFSLGIQVWRKPAGSYSVSPTFVNKRIHQSFLTTFVGPSYSASRPLLSIFVAFFWGEMYGNVMTDNVNDCKHAMSLQGADTRVLALLYDSLDDHGCMVMVPWR